MEGRSLLQGGSEPQGESTVLEEREERDKKRLRGKRECSLEPRYKSALKGKTEV